MRLKKKGFLKMAKYIPSNNVNSTNFMRDSKAMPSDFDVDDDKPSLWSFIGTLGFVCVLLLIVIL